MIDVTQFFLILAIIVFSGVFVALGSQIFFILREIRESVKRVNKVLDDTGVITESVSKPVNMLSGVVMGIKGGAGIAKFLNNKKSDV